MHFLCLVRLVCNMNWIGGLIDFVGLFYGVYSSHTSINYCVAARLYVPQKLVFPWWMVFCHV